MGLVPRGIGLRDPNLRDRLYELLEHDPLAYSIGSRFIQIIIGVIVLDVAAMILASVPELAAQFGVLFSAVAILCVIVFALEYAARLWTVAGMAARVPLSSHLSAFEIADIIHGCCCSMPRTFTP